MERIEKEFVFAATGTTGTPEYWNIDENGEIVDIIVEMPNFSNAVTGTLSVVDKGSYTLYAKDLIPENGTSHFVDLLAKKLEPIPVVQTTNLYFTISGAAGGTGGTVTVVLYIKQDGSRK